MKTFYKNKSLQYSAADYYGYRLLFLSLLLLSSIKNFSQTTAIDTTTFKTVIAGKEYSASKSYRRLWGNNYRDVWTSPVTIKILWLDTAKGGLKPLIQGGGNQTKTLHLQNANGQQYSIRSVNKTLGKVLPEKFRGTFIQDHVNDEVSMSNPYAAVTIPYLAEKAKVYHTNPELVYVPKQPALNNYNNIYGDNFYLFEQRTESNWKDADNLGNFETYIETVTLLDTLKTCTACTIDRQAFIRARLFDMFINDWDRHENQWTWGIKKEGNKTIFVPVPKDRDQAYSTHDGFLLNIALGSFDYMQAFNNNLKDVKTFNYEERNLDRRLLNETTLIEWLTIADDLQKLLTDDVIEKAVQQLPKEIFPLASNKIIETLKARKNHIKEWATAYYLFISKEVEIPGSYLDDIFSLQQLNDKETIVKLYNKNENDSPYYSRTFNSSETKEIRLFGLKGANKFSLNTNTANDIKIKIISESAADTIVSSNQKNITAYSINDVKQTGENVKNINDTTNRSYNYNWFRYDKDGKSIYALYSYEDHLYISLGYKFKHYRWGKEPYASSQLISTHYSLIENAFSFYYKALFPLLIAKSDLAINANYDAERWRHFLGVGNDTKNRDARTREFYTMRLRLYNVQPELIKYVGKSAFSVFVNVQGAKVLNDTDRFVSKVFIQDNSLYKWKTFAGGGVSYTFQSLNDIIVPTKGIYFKAIATGLQNVNDKSSYNFNYSGAAHVYVPLVSKFSLGVRVGAATVTGKPEFYQLNTLGGPTLRGVLRDRFWGKTIFYNLNDLRFITPVQSKIYKGKIGFVALFDNGRVWNDEEHSNIWHTAVGGGFIFVPFNSLYVDATYGVTDSEHHIQIRLTTYLNKKK